jgi:hypothetical protein
VATVLVFRWCLPDEGRVARFVGTEWEPYFAVLIAMGVIMGLGFIALGVTETLGLG